VIRGDHRVEFTPHRPHKNRIRREGPVDSGCACGGLENFGVFAAESPAIAGVRIERAQCDSRRRDAEPSLQPVASDARTFNNGRRASS